MGRRSSVLFVYVIPILLFLVVHIGGACKGLSFSVSLSSFSFLSVTHKATVALCAAEALMLILVTVTQTLPVTGLKGSFIFVKDKNVFCLTKNTMYLFVHFVMRLIRVAISG